MRGAENMYNKEMLYTFIGEIRDIVWRDLLENNKNYSSHDKNASKLWDSLGDVSEEINDKLMELEEALVSRSNIMEEAMYLKGFEDAFALVALMSQGCIIKKYSEITNEGINKAS